MTDHEPGAPGDLSAALEAVLRRFRTMVRSVGARHALPEHDLDVLLQEVRVRLWRGRTTSEEISALPTSYVYQAATSAAIDLLRQRRRRETRHVDDGDLSLGQIEVRGSAEDDLAAQELARRVETVLAGLVVTRRVVVRMSLAGYSRQEIGARLGWSDAKVRNLLSRGMQDLRDALRSQLDRDVDESL
jgi:RNA polymerase sigma factor (sigma-70 family)